MRRFFVKSERLGEPVHTSNDFTQVLTANGIKIGMDGKGRWVDNVFVEHRPKKELGALPPTLYAPPTSSLIMIIVTGAAGFIGSNFVLDWLSNYQEPVVSLDKLTYAGNLNNLAAVSNHQDHSFVHGDIGDSALVNELLAEYTPRAVLNFAAESHVDRSIHGPSEFIQTNIVGTFNLLESLRGYWSNLPATEQRSFRFLQVSTDEVYGTLEEQDPAFTERNQYRPNSPYSASKAASDHLVRAYHHTYGLPVLTTNCSNNYGPFHFPEKLIPMAITRALAGSNKTIRNGRSADR